MAKKTLSEILNTHPDPAHLTTKKGTNYTYIPVGVVENMLDELFGVGGWQTTNFKYEFVDKEIIGELTLLVFINGVWVSRVGAASTQIRHYNNNHKTNPGEKIPNTLEMDFPKLLANCLSNAAKKLGKWFGRDLNRDHVDNFDAATTEVLSSNDQRPWFRQSNKRWEKSLEALRAKKTTVADIIATYQVTETDLEILKNAEENK